jgi:hypothetical protein
MPRAFPTNETVSFCLTGAVLRTFASASTIGPDASDIPYLSRVPMDDYPEPCASAEALSNHPDENSDL